MAKTEITEEEALQMAIDHFLQQAPRNCGVMYEQYTAVAEWLQELAAFKDETPITKAFLDKNFECDFDDDDGVYSWVYKFVGLKLYGNTCVASMDDTKIDIYTLGQLRMFLTLCGLGDFANQLKS